MSSTTYHCTECDVQWRLLIDGTQNGIIDTVCDECIKKQEAGEDPRDECLVSSSESG